MKPTSEEQEKTKVSINNPITLGLITSIVSIALIIANGFNDYLKNQREIKTIELNNKSVEQQRIFDFVNNVVAQQGEERIFILRYLISIHSDKYVKKWAEEEICRLQKIAKNKEEKKVLVANLSELRSKNTSLNNEYTAQEDEIKLLEREILNKSFEIQKLKDFAGLKSGDSVTQFTFLEILFNWENKKIAPPTFT